MNGFIVVSLIFIILLLFLVNKNMVKLSKILIMILRK